MRGKMKKTIIVLTLLLLLLAASGMAESVLPDGISSALEADGISADRVMAVLPRIGDGPFFSFVAVQDQRGKNVLYGFSEEASGWKRIIKTEAATFQLTRYLFQTVLNPTVQISRRSFLRITRLRYVIPYIPFMLIPM